MNYENKTHSDSYRLCFMHAVQQMMKKPYLLSTIKIRLEGNQKWLILPVTRIKMLKYSELMEETLTILSCIDLKMGI